MLMPGAQAVGGGGGGGGWVWVQLELTDALWRVKRPGDVFR